MQKFPIIRGVYPSAMYTTVLVVQTAVCGYHVYPEGVGAIIGQSFIVLHEDSNVHDSHAMEIYCHKDPCAIAGIGLPTDRFWRAGRCGITVGSYHLSDSGNSAGGTCVFGASFSKKSWILHCLELPSAAIFLHVPKSHRIGDYYHENIGIALPKIRGNGPFPIRGNGM